MKKALPSRRALLFGVAAATLAGGPAAASGTGPRVAALDWSLAATALALGLVPVGIAEQRLYAEWVHEPAVPAGVPDLGLRVSPSLETLAALKPDLILTNPLNAMLQARLERIAPVFVNTTYGPEHAPLARAGAVTLALGERLGRADQARRLLAESEARIAAVRDRLAGVPSRPLLPLLVLDAHHLTAFGAGSLFDDVLAALGRPRAFAGPTGPWGTAVVDVAALATMLPADLLVVEPVPTAGRTLFGPRSLGASLLAAGGGSYRLLPPAWAYGDPIAAARFAELVADALGTAVPGAPA